MAELAQGFGLYLAHPLPGDVELPAQLFQRPGAAILQTKAEGDDPLFPGRQALEHIHQLPAEQLPPGLVGGDACLIVLDEVLEVGVLFLPHRRLEADGVLSQLYQLPHPGGLHVQLGGNFLGPVIIVVVITTIITPILLKIVFKSGPNVSTLEKGKEVTSFYEDIEKKRTE